MVAGVAVGVDVGGGARTVGAVVMTDLSDDEVELHFAEQLRGLPAYHPHWLWEAAKATPGKMVDGQLFHMLTAVFTGLFFVALVVMVVAGSSVADRLWLFVAFGTVMVVVVPLALFERRP